MSEGKTPPLKVALTDGLGDRLFGWWKAAPDRGNAWMMTAAFFITLFGAIISHSNWMAVWFAFSAAWFSWRVVVVQKTWKCAASAASPNDCRVGQ